MKKPWPILDPEPGFEPALRSFPRSISIYYSLERSPEYPAPATITYCLHCQESLHQWFAAPPR